MGITATHSGAIFAIASLNSGRGALRINGPWMVNETTEFNLSRTEFPLGDERIKMLGMEFLI
jgi:hypothetical protein